VIDALAAEGVLVRNAYADPLCSPTRAAALTGRYGSRTGIGVGLPYSPGPPSGPFSPSDGLPWLPRLLGKAGVRSFLCGKWHLTHRGVPDYHSLPVRVGFTRAAGSLWNLDAGPGVGYHAWWKNVATSAGWAEMPVTTYATTASYAEAYSALVASAAAGNRSLIWLALNAAHTPFDLPPDGLYTPVDGHNTDPKSQRYVLEAADTLLGQLREPFASAEPAAAARTLWIVMGDNGTPAAALERPWPAHQHKNTVYEGGTRVPLIVAGAVVPARGTVCDALVHAVDLWATIQELFGVPLPPLRTDSVSYAAALQDPGAFTGRGWVYVRQHEPNGFGPYTLRRHAVRDARWKLFERLNGTRELYDFVADPFEQSNLRPPSSPEQQAAVDKLSKILAANDVPGP
jgi:arylsulfatase A-like enzyme